MKRNLVLNLAYDGSLFLGWQKTLTGPSVEETLEDCFQQILQERISLQAASRTDRGVHAEGQCVNFLTNTENSLDAIKKGVNSLLPPSIRVLTLDEAPLCFHPTLHALKKEYHYRVCYNPIQQPKDRYFSWHVPYNLDLQKIEAATCYFLGEHDFSSFCNVRKNLRYQHKNRRLESIILLHPERGSLIFVIKGESFLYKMVRNIVGTLIYVGRGKLETEKIPIILESRSRSLAGVTAPAHGLTLKKIYYPDFSSLSPVLTGM